MKKREVEKNRTIIWKRENNTPINKEKGNKLKNAINNFMDVRKSDFYSIIIGDVVGFIIITIIMICCTIKYCNHIKEKDILKIF